MTSFRTLRRLALAAAMLSSSAAFPHHMGAPALSALTTGRGAHPSVTASPARLRHQPRKPGRAGRALLGLRASIPPGDTEAETRAAEQKGGAAAQVGRGIEKMVGVAGVFMFLWVFGPFPGSAYMGLASQQALVHEVFERLWIMPAVSQESLITKYGELGQYAGLFHAAPAAIWSILAPLQLSPEGRGFLQRNGHKAAGRVMLGTAALAMVGFAAIDANNLYADVHEFGGYMGPLGQAFDDTHVLSIGFNQLSQRGLAAWFLGTGVMTFLTAPSRGGDTVAHRAWALRHVGGGLWVALQRPLYGMVRVGQLLTTGDAATQHAQSDAFFVCAYLSTLLFIGGFEWYARQRVSAPPFPLK